jgi:hypothetical protein
MPPVLNFSSSYFYASIVLNPHFHQFTYRFLWLETQSYTCKMSLTVCTACDTPLTVPRKGKLTAKKTLACPRCCSNWAYACEVDLSTVHLFRRITMSTWTVNCKAE